MSELSVALAQGGEAERKQLEAAELNQLLRELRDKEAQLAGQLGSGTEGRWCGRGHGGRRLRPS